MKVAVVGAGIGGIAAAHLISKRHDVTLFERNDYVGGHTNTIEVDEDTRRVPIDTGFIVCNPKTYPTFYQLLGEWDVKLRDSDMSFGFYCDRTRVGYVGPGLREFMRKPTNILSPRLLGMIREQRSFARRTISDMEHDRIGSVTLGEYLDRIGSSRFFIENYVIPLAAAVWSSPAEGMMEFPAKTFIRFFANHGMIDLSTRPTWQTIVGGSQAYVRAFRKGFKGTLRVNSPVESISRDEDGAVIRIKGRDAERFDGVVLAMHADESLAALSDADEGERAALSAWDYHKNRVQLHTDESVMPLDRRLWASWNYLRRGEADPNALVPITYHMNRLQGLDTQREYLVSLNAANHVDPAKVLYEVEYTHPGYTARSLEAQSELRAMNGTRQTYFCGAYLRYGFHEDGVVSAIKVAKHFGVSL